MSDSESPLEHGGNIAAVSQAYGIARSQWLDLSTGINPYPYPVGDLPADLFQQLPYQSEAFCQAVTAYYGGHEWVAGNGSQQFIALLPKVLPALPVLLPDLGYQEHERFWRFNANPLQHYPAFGLQQATQAIDEALQQNPAQHLVVINPNNPSGLLLSTNQLIAWANQLQGGTLIVDEAFIDATSNSNSNTNFNANPNVSLLQPAQSELPENVIVLRSFGKFFGLAGVRLGFAFGRQKNEALRALKQWVGPWNINGAAQALAQKALTDHAWQQHNRTRLDGLMASTKAAIQPLVAALNCEGQAHQALYSSYLFDTPVVDFLFDAFCQQGILLRKIQHSGPHSLLRVGRYDLAHEARFKNAVLDVTQRL